MWSERDIGPSAFECVLRVIPAQAEKASCLRLVMSFRWKLERVGRHAASVWDGGRVCSVQGPQREQTRADWGISLLDSSFHCKKLNTMIPWLLHWDLLWLWKDYCVVEFLLWFISVNRSKVIHTASCYIYMREIYSPRMYMLLSSVIAVHLHLYCCSCHKFGNALLKVHLAPIEIPGTFNVVSVSSHIRLLDLWVEEGCCCCC